MPPLSCQVPYKSAPLQVDFFLCLLSVSFSLLYHLYKLFLCWKHVTFKAFFQNLCHSLFPSLLRGYIFKGIVTDFSHDIAYIPKPALCLRLDRLSQMRSKLFPPVEMPMHTSPSVTMAGKKNVQLSGSSTALHGMCLCLQS